MSNKTKTQSNKNENFDINVPERPLDPSRNASDLMGDPSGMTGWTVGSGPDTSAEPTEEQIGTENLPGGILEHETSHPSTGIPKEAVSNKEYMKNIWKKMSQSKAEESDDTAAEGEIFQSVSEVLEPPPKHEEDTYNQDMLREESAGDDSPGSDEMNTGSAPYTQGESVGEQEISGSAPDPNSDDDALASAQAVGTQLDETSENPEEIDIGRDIDKAEEYVRKH